MNKVGISINMGKACNFRCKYCFEVKNGAVESKESLYPKTFDRVIELLHVLQENNDLVHVEFWGGEPLIYFKDVYRIVKEFSMYDNVEFFMYTNGSLVNKYKKELLELKNLIGKRLQVQVSYDFHNEENNQRVQLGKTVMETDKVVKEAIHFFDDNGFNFGIKSTCTVNDLENNIYQQYVNYDKFNQTLKHKVVFACTPDTLSDGLIDFDKMNNQFIKLIQYFIDNKKDNHGYTGFVWFDTADRADCHGGDDSFIVDLDGRVTYCHGCLYADDKMFYTNIFDDNCLYKIEHNYLVRNNMFAKNSKCQECDSIFCFRCNSINSNGKVEDWNKSNNDSVCAMYKKISNYIKAYQKMRRN